MRIRLSVNAQHYLRQESAYLRQRRPSASMAFSREMKLALAVLAKFPEAGFEEPELLAPGARRLLRHGYRIDYLVRADGVWVNAIASSVNTRLSVPSDDPDYEV